MVDLFHMYPEELFGTIFNDMANVGEVAPDPEDIDAAVKGYEEASTTARLVWERRDDPKMPRRLRRVTTPALVVGAEHDRLVPDEAADAYAAALPDAELVRIPGTGHALVVEQPVARRQGHPRLPGARAMNEMQFFHFGLMPYPFIPPGSEIESTWVTLSNAHYDPKVGARLYQEYLSQAVLAEKLGYDGTCVNEHHQNAYGTMPDPNVMGSQIVARTSKIPVGIIGNALPLHDNPVRVAEAVAMLDVLSEGRIISGFVRGTGMEYHSMRANPAYSRERFWEAHDLILKAWTERRPVRLEGQALRHPVREPLAEALPAAASADLAARGRARWRRSRRRRSAATRS